MEMKRMSNLSLSLSISLALALAVSIFAKGAFARACVLCG